MENKDCSLLEYTQNRRKAQNTPGFSCETLTNKSSVPQTQSGTAANIENKQPTNKFFIFCLSLQKHFTKFADIFNNISSIYIPILRQNAFRRGGESAALRRFQGGRWRVEFRTPVRAWIMIVCGYRKNGGYIFLPFNPLSTQFDKTIYQSRRSLPTLTTNH